MVLMHGPIAVKLEALQVKALIKQLKGARHVGSVLSLPMFFPEMSGCYVGRSFFIV